LGRPAPGRLPVLPGAARRDSVRPMVEVKQIGIVLFQDVEELDAIGPWEVLSYWSRNFPEDGYEASCLSRLGGLVECAKGLTVQAHHSYADAPPLEVLLYPGGKGTRPHLRDDAQLDWVRRQRDDVPLMTSVCTGSLVYAAAGLLSHRPATTHWGSLDRLAELDPSIDVRPDERFVDDGDVVTSAGISAGIDMALHLVNRLAGTERARQVRRGIQYDPAPPI
jgi:transcriptional regulator GlxA family with amidase domain